MTSSQLVARSLGYYWRTNLAVILGVATAVSVLAGALLVGDSVRGSLRDLVLQRLGRTDRVVISPAGFFRAELANGIQLSPQFVTWFDGAVPLLAVEAAISEEATGRRASRVQVHGVDDRFWRFHGVTPVVLNGREAALSPALAAEIGAVRDGTVLVRIEQPSAIPLESLHARKDNRGRSIRLTVRAIVPSNELGDFSLRPQQGDVRALFVPLERLQRDIGIGSSANVLLVSNKPGASPPPGALEEMLRSWLLPIDFGLTVRPIGNDDALVVETPAGLIDAPRAGAIDLAAASQNMTAKPVMTYLANSMRTADREVPYSLVTAVDLHMIAPALTAADPSGPPPIVINDWTASDLAAKVGDPLTLEYYVWQEPGVLLTRTADFRIAAIVPIEGIAADRDFAPTYPGISAAETLGDWDPPFPIDLERVRPVDEDYWKQYRTTPKAFVPLETGQALWGSRFGNRTSVRVLFDPSRGSARDLVGALDAAIRDRLDPFALGLTVRDARAEGLAASRGATDFGEYFAYFSFFLVISALTLAALFFRLGVEQRAREVGLLRSVGFAPARVRRLFTIEGVCLALVGSAIGCAGAVAYGAAMMAGLRTWWSGAVGTTSLTLHVAPQSLAAGAAGALVAAAVCIWVTLRGLSKLSERSLLAGRLAGDAAGGRVAPARWPLAGAIACAAIAGALAVAGAAGAIDATAAFFGAGSAMLMACISATAFALRRPPRSSLAGRAAIARLGLRNATNRPGRSVLAIGVIASAAFILIAVDAFRHEGPAATDRHSGGGGYSVLVDLLVPLAQDPNSREGRDTLGLGGMKDVAVEPFRVRPGDDTSCLNLYEPRSPRVLGVRAPFITSNRFAFGASLAANDAERANPWLLLDRRFDDPDVVPVVADANSITYVLHKSVGDEVVVDAGGRPVRLRLMAALADSIFQRELLMSESNFVRLFPEQQGFQFLLIETRDAPAVERAVEQGAPDLGADAASTGARLAEFHRVENTYLSTFQTLGGLGLLVGTVGLAAVVLRNVLERRRELALLGATGYRREHIFAIVASENALLLGCGLAAGAVSALVAIAPALAARGGRLPLTASGAALVVAVLAAGLVSSSVATRAALRAPLLDALRAE